MRRSPNYRHVGRFLLFVALALTPLAEAQYIGVLVTGIPDYDDDPGVVDDSGAISVLHCTQGDGVGTIFSQFFDQNETSFTSTPATNDSLGKTVVVGDFNGDGFPDIATGIPWEDVGGKSGAGMVQVVYGHALGFIGYADQQALHHNVVAVDGEPCTRCQFGAALAVGDFDGDGFDDLAVGSPEYYMGSTIGDGGAVNVFYGTATGFNGVDEQFWTQDSDDILNEAYDGDYFGAALAAGDFNGDGYDDLAIGVPYETVGGGIAHEEGAVNVIYGGASGLAALAPVSNQFWYQGNGLDETPEDYDHFGAVLAVGDFDGDGYDDLAVSSPGESLPGAVETGVVHIISGWGTGLVTWNDELWSQNSAGMPDPAEQGDHFGAALAAGDFNGDGYDDLAIGVPDEDLYEFTELFAYEAGAVHVLHGSEYMLDVTGNQSLIQGTALVPGVINDYEHFGTALAAADLDGDGYSDLVIGVPGDNAGGVTDAGAVHVVYGSANSVASYDVQYWHLDSTNVAGSAQENAGFGSSLAAINFSVIFVDRFERGDAGSWSSAVH